MSRTVLDELHELGARYKALYNHVAQHSPHLTTDAAFAEIGENREPVAPQRIVLSANGVPQLLLHASATEQYAQQVVNAWTQTQRNAADAAYPLHVPAVTYSYAFVPEQSPQ